MQYVNVCVCLSIPFSLPTRQTTPGRDEQSCLYLSTSSDVRTRRSVCGRGSGGWSDKHRKKSILTCFTVLLLVTYLTNAESWVKNTYLNPNYTILTILLYYSLKNKVYLKNAPYGASSFSCDPGGLF